MSDVPPIDGVNAPNSSSSLSSDKSVDAEKFKKMMKVEDSEETGKKEKRKKPKKQEEEEDLQKKETPLHTPMQGKFAGLMEVREKKQASKGGKKVKTEVPSNINLKDSNLTTKLTKKNSSDESPFLHLEEILPKGAKWDIEKSLHKALKSELSKAESLQKEPSDEILKDEIAAFKGNLEKLHEEKKEISIDLSHAEESAISALVHDKKLLETEKEATKEVEKLYKTETKYSKDETKHHKKEEEQASASSATIQTQTPQGIQESSILEAPSPSYASLPKEVYELFAKMVGLLMIEEGKGISITTIKINMPKSVFDECEIRLEHFDTAPNSFNIQLIGNPNAIALFNSNFTQIANSLKTGGYNFQANLKRPILSETYHSFSKKANDKESEDKASA